MLRRAFCFSLLVFQAIWLNVIVPGHTRGVVELPGGECEACRQPLLACCSEKQTGKPAHTPAHDPASNCAICHFAARLTLPPVIDFSPPRLGLAEVAEPPAPMSAPSVRLPLILHDRAPPCVA